MKGSKQFQAKLRKIARDARPLLEKAALKGADEIADTARRLAPRGKGDLVRSIGSGLGDPPRTASTQKLRGSGGSKEPVVKASIWAGDDKAFYAGLVEFGSAPHVQGGLYRTANPTVSHPGTPAQPFFFPAYRLGRKRAKARMARAVKQAIKGASK